MDLKTAKYLAPVSVCVYGFEDLQRFPSGIRTKTHCCKIGRRRPVVVRHLNHEIYHLDYLPMFNDLFAVLSKIGLIP